MVTINLYARQQKSKAEFLSSDGSRAPLQSGPLRTMGAPAAWLMLATPPSSLLAVS